MAEISASAVMALRNKLGVSMMECKKALVEANGDEEKAIELLKEKGMAKAASKSDRETFEGAIAIAGKAAVKILCETDFVARNDQFLAFVSELAEKANAEGKDAVEAYFESVKAQKVIQLGENLVLAEVVVVDGPIVAGYVHSNKKAAAIVALSGGTSSLAVDVAMHVTAMKPIAMSYKDLDPTFVEEETKGRIEAIRNENEELARLGKTLKNIPEYISMLQITPEVLAKAEENIRAELKAEGKPDQIIEKILPGKLSRFISDNTTLDQEQALLDQNFVKNPDQRVGELLSSAGVELLSFVRVEI